MKIGKQMQPNNRLTLIFTAVIFAALAARAGDATATNSVEAAPPTAPAITGPLQYGFALNAQDAPQIANHAFQVSAEIEPADTNGVILAQGAGGYGYALYLKDGKPAFAVRNETKLTTVIADAPLGSGHFKVEAKLAADGAITISVDGKTVATGQAPGLIAAQPARGLSVGLNYKSVGDYTAPNPFTGKIENAKVQTW
jgi:hypothetical protein